MLVILHLKCCRKAEGGRGGTYSRKVASVKCRHLVLGTLGLWDRLQRIKT